MINNYKDFKKYLNSLEQKPTLLLHSCCAPCSSHTLLLLKNYFSITIFYSNDNIYPIEEFQLRLEEQRKFVKEIDTDIEVLTESFEPSDFYHQIKGLESLGEKSQRCYQCYLLRMEKTAKKALELKYDFFTTTLSISPHKNSDWINEIGYMLEKKYNVKYLYSDFKKDSGYQDSILLSKQYGLYRQDYCGCIYSMREREVHHETDKD